MEIFRNPPELSFNLVAAHNEAFNLLPAEQLCGLKAMLASDKDGPLLARADSRWSVEADGFNGIGNYTDLVFNEWSMLAEHSDISNAKVLNGGLHDQAPLVTGVGHIGAGPPRVERINA
jgi:hypothetical protein